MSIRKKVIIYFGSSLVVLISIFFLVDKSNLYSVETSALVTHTNEVLLQNQKILNYAQELENTVEGFLLSGKEEYARAFVRVSSTIPSAVTNLKKITSDNLYQQVRIDSLRQLIAGNLELKKELVAIRKNKGFGTAYKFFSRREGRVMMEDLKMLVGRIDAEEKRLLTEREVENRNSVGNLTNTIALLEIFIIIVLTVGFMVIYQSIGKRIEAEGSLKKNKYFIEGIINNSNNPILIKDLSGKYILANSSSAKAFNRSLDEIVGKNYDELLPNDVAAKIRETENHILQTKSTVVAEYRIPNGQEVYHYSSSSFPVFVEDEIYAIGSVLTDITTLKKGEEVLIKNNNQLQKLINGLQKLMDTSVEIICIIDKEGRYFQISSACEILLGYTPGELIGRKYIEFVHKNNVEEISKAISMAMSGIGSRNFEARHLRKDGTWIVLSWVASYSNEDDLLYAIGRDATEKKQTLSELKKSQEGMSHAQKIAKLGSWEMDLKKRQIWCSDEIYTIIGRNKEEMGTEVENYYRITFGDDLHKLRKAFRITLTTHQPWDLEYGVVRPDGTMVKVHSKGEIIYDENNQPACLAGTLQDITERKKLEEERESVIRELVKSNADLKQFSFITSHNFRAPLSNIIGILSLINYSVLDNDNAELLRMLKSSTEQLNKTIEDITNVLIIKNSGKERTDVFNIPDLFSKVEKTVEFALHKAQGIIQTDFKAQYLCCNPSYFESILFNLISNAIRYRSSERKLLIAISSDKDEDGKTALVVSDNGIGIDLTRHASKIFGLYQRFHSNADGSGLGLFMVKSQVAAMGGTIEVKSEVNKGTTFIIRI